MTARELASLIHKWYNEADDISDSIHVDDVAESLENWLNEQAKGIAQDNSGLIKELPENLLGCHGRRFIADINESKGVTGVISVYNGEVYLCQDEEEGCEFNGDHFGFDFSWCVGEGSDLESDDVLCLYLYPEEEEEEEEGVDKEDFNLADLDNYRFSYTHNGDKQEGVIRITEDINDEISAFFCQNIRIGAKPKDGDLKGFMFSWALETDISLEDVEEYFPDFQVIGPLQPDSPKTNPDHHIPFKDLDGRKFTFTYEGKREYGAIRNSKHKNGSVYSFFCQNIYNGSSIEDGDTKGYKFCFAFHPDKTYNSDEWGIKQKFPDFKLLPEEKEATTLPDKRLLKDLEGRRFSYQHQGEEHFGAIHIDGDTAYLCQNTYDGQKPSDGVQYGFKYGWSCPKKYRVEQIQKYFTDFKIVKSRKKKEKTLPEDLLGCHGQAYKCKIRDIECTGIISVDEDECVHLCQDEISGSDSADTKFGYKYSWNVNYGSASALDASDVTEFKLLD